LKSLGEEGKVKVMSVESWVLKEKEGPKMSAMTHIHIDGHTGVVEELPSRKGVGPDEILYEEITKGLFFGEVRGGPLNNVVVGGVLVVSVLGKLIRDSDVPRQARKMIHLRTVDRVRKEGLRNSRDGRWLGHLVMVDGDRHFG
jgi:hypothetical protein